MGHVSVSILRVTCISQYICAKLQKTFGGVMAFLTLHEMLPPAFEYAGQKQSVKAVFCGMAFMSAR
ncbi:zinc transporter ZTP29-like protein [Trifolium pratense]|uniref:Zinc transporter ZTP29-like protein n=1 Tax=Trifolium pratense TaxID=57577 RepID=A0A2K3L8E7_TRIPR|nr:zinc transporter ZTP29-like protein [Trifolium pratense]